MCYYNNLVVRQTVVLGAAPTGSVHFDVEMQSGRKMAWKICLSYCIVLRPNDLSIAIFNARLPCASFSSLWLFFFFYFRLDSLCVVHKYTYKRGRMYVMFMSSGKHICSSMTCSRYFPCQKIVTNLLCIRCAKAEKENEHKGGDDWMYGCAYMI